MPNKQSDNDRRDEIILNEIAESMFDEIMVIVKKRTKQVRNSEMSFAYWKTNILQIAVHLICSVLASVGVELRQKYMQKIGVSVEQLIRAGTKDEKF